MAQSINELEQDALQLPAEDRARLAVSLLCSLEETDEDSLEIEKLWVAEAARRVQEPGAAKMIVTLLRQSGTPRTAENYWPNPDWLLSPKRALRKPIRSQAPASRALPLPWGNPTALTLAGAQKT